MSLLDKASLIVTPNAYKESKLYSVIPNTTLGDMDVVRATTATRVNSLGLIEVVPRNLFTYSEQFDNAAWTKVRSTITANSVNSPTGTLTADTFTCTTTGTDGTILRQTTTLTDERTTSIFVKPNTSNYFLIHRDFGSGVVFDLTNGTIKQSSGATGTIINVGDGWYRCSATFSASGLSLFIAGNSSMTVTSWASTINQSLFIWGAQLESGSTATEYFPTTTRLNIPRIDYTNGSCPSLLVEPQRTNNALYSNSFNNWVVGGILTQNFAISPDGTQNASSLNGYMYEGSNGVGGIVSFSCFAKKNNGDNTITLIADSTPEKQAVFNLLNGTVVSVDSGFTANVVNYGNGWYRCIMTSTSSIISPLLIIRSASSGTNSTLVYGVQFESGSYPTSYIPTVASTVTRNADVISKTGISSLIGQTEGVFYAEMKLSAIESSSKGISINDGTGATNRIFLRYQSNSIRILVQKDAVVQYDNSQTILNSLNFIKIALNYKNNNFKLFLNGILVNSSLTGNTFTGSTLSIIEFDDGLTNPFFGNINSVQLYKTALTDSECIQLTTL